MNGYDLARAWYNYKFDHPQKVKAIHSDFYFYLVDQWNRYGQKAQFGLPTSYTMECLQIGSYNTYKKVFNDLVEFGFVKLIQDSVNQHQSRIIALSNNDKALDKALDKATMFALSKSDEAHDEAHDETHDETHDEASDETPDETPDDISKQVNKETIKQRNKETIDSRKLKFSHTLKPFVEVYGKDLMNEFYSYWTEPNQSNTKFRKELEKTWDVERRLNTWSKNQKNFKTNQNGKFKNADEQMQDTINRILGSERKESQSITIEPNIPFSSFTDVTPF